MKTNTAEIELLNESTSIATLRCNGYVIQMQDCDLDAACHGGLNILLPGGGYAPIPESLNGHPFFVIQNTTQTIRNAAEIGWLITAPDLKTAIEYALSN